MVIKQFLIYYKNYNSLIKNRFVYYQDDKLIYKLNKQNNLKFKTNGKYILMYNC
jgi:hypothetical protein